MNYFDSALGNNRFRCRTKMRAVLVAFFMSHHLAIAAPPLPIRSGQYVFQHRYAEQPTMPSIKLLAKIAGHHIILINQSKSDVFPLGVIVNGELMWNAQVKQWIIGQTKADRDAKEVGGCSEGPEIIDLVKKIYWTC